MTSPQTLCLIYWYTSGKKISFNPAAKEYDIYKQSYQKCKAFKTMKKSATEKKNISSKILIIDHVLLTTLVYVMLQECYAPSCKRMECFD